MEAVSVETKATLALLEVTNLFAAEIKKLQALCLKSLADVKTLEHETEIQENQKFALREEKQDWMEMAAAIQNILDAHPQKSKLRSAISLEILKSDNWPAWSTQEQYDLSSDQEALLPYSEHLPVGIIDGDPLEFAGI